MLHLLHNSFSQRSLLFSFVKLFNEEKIYKFWCLWCSRRNLTNREYRKNRIQNKKFSLFLVFAVWQNNVATNWCTKVNLCTKCGVNAPCCQQRQQTFVKKGKQNTCCKQWDACTGTKEAATSPLNALSIEEGMELEDKAKVVASVWGAECVQFLSPLAVLPRLIWKKRMNSTVSSK